MDEGVGVGFEALAARDFWLAPQYLHLPLPDFSAVEAGPGEAPVIIDRSRPRIDVLGGFDVEVARSVPTIQVCAIDSNQMLPSSVEKDLAMECLPFADFEQYTLRRAMRLVSFVTPMPKICLVRM